MTLSKRARGDRRGFLGRLAGDKAGNTLALMAAFLIPMTALVGSAVDVARLYVVKVRLQQACDAGVLAGRKFMLDSASPTLDPNADAQARTFFTNNLRNGWMLTHDEQFTPVKTADNQVSATAQTTVPMTITKMLGVTESTLNVSCQARYDVADTDVMFVLDTTGSMSCTPSDSTSCANGPVVAYNRSDGSTDYYNPEKPGSKLQAVRDAVKSFYETFQNNSDPSTHVRYGFVAYNSTVNVGQAIYSVSPSYFVNNWTYQSRKVTADYTISSSTTVNTSANSSAACNALDGRTPATPLTYNGSGTATQVDGTWTTPGRGPPYCSVTTYTLGPHWTYQPVTYPTSAYVGTISGGTVTDPSKVDSSTTAWNGCIEERGTTAGNNDPSDYDINNLPPDLDPDLIPNTGDATTLWRPQWTSVEYARNYFNSTNTQQADGDSASTPDDSRNFPSAANFRGYTMLSAGFSVCPAQASRLSVKSETDVMNYMNSLTPHGGTYHDIGMIWGTRMLSPNGIFASDTAPWPGRQQPNRVIVFLTDGQMAPDPDIYSAYGIEYYDKRVTGGAGGNLADYHNARFLTECAAAKQRNISVWVVAVGQSLTPQLTACATTSSQALYAGSGADLTAAFQTIAKKVAMLRISQ